MYVWIIAIAALLTLVILGYHTRQRRERLTDAEVASVIEHYLHGGGGAWDWANFVERPFKNPRLEKLRIVCLDAEAKLPDERESVLLEVVKRLRAEGPH